MTDPYKTLGVERGAAAGEIKRAYRELAKKLHPDLNPGNNRIEQKFKEVSHAYSILGDADKRRRFDRGEIDASGQATGRKGGFYRDQAQHGRSSKYRQPADFASSEGFAASAGFSPGSSSLARRSTMTTTMRARIRQIMPESR